MTRRNEPGAVAAWNPDDGSPILDDGTVWLHGHIRADRAARAVDRELADSTVWPPTEWRAGPVEHAHARKVPSLDEQGDRCTAVVLSAPGRGAFPVTIITLERR